jgi:soluble lytic murein transglycosylase
MPTNRKLKPAFPLKTLTAIALCTTFFSAPLSASLKEEPPRASQESTAAEFRQQERETYLKAREMLKDQDFDAYRKIRGSLTNYPLFPYLEYSYLTQRLDQAQSADVLHFTQHYADTPLAAPLQYRWLKHLAKTDQWQPFLDNFNSEIKSAELQCYALWAQHQNGQTEQALEKVPNLWLVGYSQSDACNPIFALWVDEGHLNDEMAWQRFQLAMRAGNSRLAHYLIRFMSPTHQEQAKLYRDIYLHPEKLEKTTRFKPFNEVHRDIIFEGFKRLARQDALLAFEVWPEYVTRQTFHPHEISEIHQLIMMWLAHQDNNGKFYQAITKHNSLVTSDVLEAGIRMAIRAQDWENIIALVERLPDDARQSTRSQYWLTRAQLETGVATAKQIRPQLEAIAQQRDFYSFLAADQLQRPYRMNHKSYAIDGNFLERFKVLPAIVRTRELLAAGQTVEARREWFRATQHFNSDQHYAAAHYAKQLNWHDQAIRSAIAAKRWHDLELRFPLAYEATIEHAAQARQLNSNWLMAMARQESAMTHDAVSGKNARGLIQMLPSTARTVARKNKISFRGEKDLFDPAKNIELASAYLSSLLEEFNNNDIYATAAYNAGPHRVKKWLEMTADLPIDVWIESIPYHETRQYVKNVLTYSAVYAHRRNQQGVQMATVNYQSDKE